MFYDRASAGVALARKLQGQSLRRPVLVLGLPRGGAPVAYEVARALKAPLDVMLVRKIGMPGQPELAIGAIASGDVIVHAPRVAHERINFDGVFERLVNQQRRELERREHLYRTNRGPLDLKGKTVILVDDGLATGFTMLAAIRAARKLAAASVIVAAPVASLEAADLVSAEADEVVILRTPARLSAVGEWYRDFGQTQDAEVCRLLALNRQDPTRATGSRISA
jgi:predicted phosphoribosyltransferase